MKRNKKLISGCLFAIIMSIAINAFAVVVVDGRNASKVTGSTPYSMGPHDNACCNYYFRF